jgi:hypothetical protein
LTQPADVSSPKSRKQPKTQRKKFCSEKLSLALLKDSVLTFSATFLAYFGLFWLILAYFGLF